MASIHKVFFEFPKYDKEGLETLRNFIHTQPLDIIEIFETAYKDHPNLLNNLMYDWRLWRRPEQIIDNMPREKDTLMWLCGRGWGKTRNMSSTAIDLCLNNKRERVSLWGKSGPTIERNNINGDSGIIKNIHPDIEYDYNATKKRFVFGNGAEIQCFSARDIESSRGSQCSTLLCDEICAWDYPDEAYSEAKTTLRLGRKLRTFIATTPKPTPLIKKLAKDEDVYVVNGSTHLNYFLTDKYVKNLMKDLTQRMIRQEIYAEILDDNQYALWRDVDILKTTEFERENLFRNGYKRVVVAVDPAVTSNEKSDETGIVVVARGYDDRGYVLADLSMKGTPDEWGKTVVQAYHRFKADRVVAEVNQGGDLVERLIRDIGGLGFPPVKKVRATRGKEVRAEPIAAMYERHEITHVDDFELLERQMCDWNPALDQKSPDRVDALVWGLTEVMTNKGYAEAKVGQMGAMVMDNPYVDFGM